MKYVHTHIKVAKVAQVAEGERASPEGKVCRFNSYSGTNF